METLSKQFVHTPLNEEVRAIGGHYVPAKEIRLPYGGREIFYRIGYAAVDNSCCSFGGCGYAQVPGYTLAWKTEKDEHGNPISRFEPITDRNVQRAVRRLIAKEEGIRDSMVNFD